MDTKNRNLEVRKTVIINSAPEKVFKDITEPQELVRWFQDQAIFEAKVGGRVRFVTLKDVHPDWKLDRDYIMEGKVKEYIPNKKISYSWKFDDIADFPETLVTWRLEGLEGNKTKLELTHVGFTGEENGNFSVQSHTQGWDEALKKLANL